MCGEKPIMTLTRKKFQVRPGEIRKRLNSGGKNFTGQEVIFYCVRGGSVSKSVSEKLMEKNINARYIEGGIAAWIVSGSPVAEK